MVEMDIKYKDILQKVKRETIAAFIEYLKPFTDSSISALKKYVQTIFKKVSIFKQIQKQSRISLKIYKFSKYCIYFSYKDRNKNKKENLIPQLNVQQTALKNVVTEFAEDLNEDSKTSQKKPHFNPNLRCKKRN